MKHEPKKQKSRREKLKANNTNNNKTVLKVVPEKTDEGRAVLGGSHCIGSIWQEEFSHQCGTSQDCTHPESTAWCPRQSTDIAVA